MPSAAQPQATIELAASEPEPALAGSRCTRAGCDTHVFPTAASCPRCGDDTETVALPTSGVLWSVTVQRIRPKPPFVFDPDTEFEPFAVGYVDVGPLKIEGRLDGRPVDAWSIGQAMKLRVDGVDDGDGSAAVRYRWVPA